MKHKAVLTVALIWSLVVVAALSVALTLLAVGGNGRLRVVTEEQYALIERYGRLDEIRETLMTRYYQPLDEETLVTGAIRGLMDAVDDPYTYYYTAEELEKSNDTANGVYHGVGMLVQLAADNGVDVLRVYEGSPAEEAGLQAGDRITAIDGEELLRDDARALEDAVQRIQGPDGTTVSITVQRHDGQHTYEVMRAQVNVSYVNCTVLDDGIGYIALDQFSGNDVSGFQQAIDELTGADIRGVVVDLRNNPGGLLSDVVSIADMVLPEGLVTYVEDRDGRRDQYSVDENYWDVPMVVLVNGASASASELFTAAFQDDGRGVVVGTTTFGKGIVQTLVTYDEGDGMQYTMASYFSPKGRSLHKSGVTPDIVVEPDEGDIIDPVRPDPAADRQLAEAIRALEEEIASEPAA